MWYFYFLGLAAKGNSLAPGGLHRTAQSHHQTAKEPKSQPYRHARAGRKKKQAKAVRHSYPNRVPRALPRQQPDQRVPLQKVTSDKYRTYLRHSEERVCRLERRTKKRMTSPPANHRGGSYRFESEPQRWSPKPTKSHNGESQ